MLLQRIVKVLGWPEDGSLGAAKFPQWREMRKALTIANKSLSLSQLAIIDQQQLSKLLLMSIK